MPPELRVTVPNFTNTLPEKPLVAVKVSVLLPVLVRPRAPPMLPAYVVSWLLLTVSTGAPVEVLIVPLPARLAKL